MEPWYALLECPACREDLDLEGGSLVCAAEHRYDVARQGYVNLLPGGAQTGTADTAAMVSARRAFLAGGHFRPLAAALARAAAAAAGAAGCIVESGAGTGYYLAAVLDAMPDRVGLALDISKHAARVAARAHPGIGAVVCDSWRRLPVRGGSAAVVMSVFAPRNVDEFCRILAPGGIVLTATPCSGHLAELRALPGTLSVDPRKGERIGRSFGDRLMRENVERVESPLALSHADVEAVVLMGPSAHHVVPGDLMTAIAGLPDPVPVTLSVDVTVWRACQPLR